MVGYLSDIGNFRELNEDYIDYIIHKDFKLYIIADGMGGHNAGEIASKMAVELIMSFVQDNYNHIRKNKLLISAIEYANEKIHEASLDSIKYNGMGTTVTACLMIDGDIFIANVGDSCCYLIDKEGIRKVTHDHTFVQELLDEGSITEEQAFHHPIKNFITRSVGTYKDIDVDIYRLKDDNFKFLILCTDGLSDEVEKDDILNIVNSSKDINESCSLLINLAKARGGKDNISVLIIGGEK